MLGPLEVQEGENTLQLGGPKQRTLLALLLLRAGEVVSVDALTDALWGDQPPRTSSTAIHNFVAEMRKLLGPERLVTRAPGYVLQVEDDELDVQQVRRLVAAAKVAPPEERIELLRRAESYWRGPPLLDFAYEEFARRRTRLEELRLAAREDLIEAELELGEHAEARAPSSRRWCCEHPLRERLREQLMIALYRSGRQADAREAYQAARRVLVDELGLEPGPALQQLHAAIIRQERCGVDERKHAAHRAVDDRADVATVLLEGRRRAGPRRGRRGPRRAGSSSDSTPARRTETLPRVSQYAAAMRGYGPLYDELHELVGIAAARRQCIDSSHRFRRRGCARQARRTSYS